MLRGLDPQSDYADMTSFINPTSGRLSVTDDGQKYDLIYGGDGIYAPTGVIVEGFPVREVVGRRKFRVILSIARSFSSISFENSQAKLSAFCKANLTNFIFKTRCAPVYSFTAATVNATAIIGSVIWPSDAIGDEPIQERLTGDMSAGGSVRIEYEFQARYSIVRT